MRIAGRCMSGVSRRPPSESNHGAIHVIGLGCGGGQKDTRLLKLLKTRGREVFYTPCDVSTAMVLVARRTALAVVPEKNCFPFVCDLATAQDLPDLLATRHPSLITFFGMIPNFEPQIILPRLASLVRPKDWLLFSANLAPGKQLRRRVKKNSAAIRQSAHPRLAADVPVRPRSRPQRWGSAVFS